MDKYTRLKIQLAFSAIYNKQITFRKIINAVTCHLAYKLGLTIGARAPFAINFELCNECNTNCVFCRSIKGDIPNQNPHGSSAHIPKGKMPLELFQEVIEQVKDYLLIAILYVNGEPLLYKNIYIAIKFANERYIATMIASNGLILTEVNSSKLIDAGLNFLKVGISGFSQHTYEVQHKIGNVEIVKKNLTDLAKAIKSKNSKLLVMFDFFVYDYNQHEVEDAKEFAKKHNFIFNLRPGLEKTEESLTPHIANQQLKKVTTCCDWPWKMLTVNWDGGIYPCCDYLIWSNSKPYAIFERGATNLLQLWNSNILQQYRKIHSKQGRQAIDVCRNCQRKGTAFKY